MKHMAYVCIMISMTMVSGCMHRSCADYTLLYHIENSAISPDSDREHWESLQKQKIPKAETKKLETKKKLMKKFLELEEEKKKTPRTPRYGNVEQLKQPGRLKVSFLYNNRATPTIELFR